MATTTRQSAVVTTRGDKDIVITREFAAPARLVWRAVTEPELIRRWWHSGRGEMTVCDVDLRVGGKWRYVMDADGFEVAFSGEYREIEPGVRAVFTELYEGMPGATEDDAAVNTMTLVEADGRTTLTILVQHAKPEHREAHLASGMEAGMQDAYDLLEDVAVSLG